MRLGSRAPEAREWLERVCTVECFLGAAALVAAVICIRPPSEPGAFPGGLDRHAVLTSAMQGALGAGPLDCLDDSHGFVRHRVSPAQPSTGATGWRSAGRAERAAEPPFVSRVGGVALTVGDGNQPSVY